MAMRVLICVTLLIVHQCVCLSTMDGHWIKTGVNKICHLGNTGSSTITAPSLFVSLSFALFNNRTAVSYDAPSSTATFHDGATIHTTQEDIYTHNSYPKDCTEVNPIYCSGVFQVTPIPGVSFDVYCDMDTAGGPWTVIQNREDGTVDFYRNWTEYKIGFGDLLGNFWIGNDKLHLVTPVKSTLRIELQSWNGTVGYAEYSEFQIGNEADNYRIHVQGYSGNISDSMDYINGSPFSTLDRDNYDGDVTSCAVTRHGAWWYRACSHANLNGRYKEDTQNDQTSMAWKYFFADRGHVPMKTSRMLVKKP